MSEPGGAGPGRLAPFPSLHLLSIRAAAPHALRPPPCSMALAAKRGTAFGTCNKVNAAMIKALSAAQAAARAGNLGAFMAARSKIQSLLATVAVQVRPPCGLRAGERRWQARAALPPPAVSRGRPAASGCMRQAPPPPHPTPTSPPRPSTRNPAPCPAAQATIEYAEQTEAARKAGEPTAELQAEGYAFFRTIEPLVAQASPTAAATVRKLLYPGEAWSEGVGGGRRAPGLRVPLTRPRRPRPRLPLAPHASHCPCPPAPHPHPHPHPHPQATPLSPTSTPRSPPPCAPRTPAWASPPPRSAPTAPPPARAEAPPLPAAPPPARVPLRPRLGSPPAAECRDAPAAPAPCHAQSA
jgi:hypothetical protein